MNGSRPRGRGSARAAHPRFTSFPVAAYVFAAVFDLASLAGGPRHPWAGQLWHAGTFVLAAGSVFGLATLSTGFADLIRFARPALLRAAGTSGRMVAGHVAVMSVAFAIGAGDLAWRLHDHAATVTPPAIAGLSAAATATVIAGGFLGGKLVYGHGIGVSLPPAGTESDLPGQAAGHDHVRGAPDMPGTPGARPPREAWPQVDWPRADPTAAAPDGRRPPLG
jgi:uncharacterized membrane protein